MAMKLTLIGLAAVALVVLAGCGGSGEMTQVQEAQAPGALLVGKTMPDFANLLPSATKSVPQLLKFNQPGTSGKVNGGMINWFRTPYGDGKRVVVTLQQAANQDSDLYAFRRALMLPDALLVSSSRGANPADPDTTPGGVPDWVQFVITSGNGPVWLGIWGTGASGQVNNFRVELDVVQPLRANEANATHGTAPNNDSRWYRFRAQQGLLHTIICSEALNSDPDLALYRENSSGFVMANFTAGSGGSMSFIPQDSDMYYLRVYGRGNATLNHYDLRLTVGS